MSTVFPALTNSLNNNNQLDNFSLKNTLPSLLSPASLRAEFTFNEPNLSSGTLPHIEVSDNSPVMLPDNVFTRGSSTFPEIELNNSHINNGDNLLTNDDFDFSSGIFSGSVTPKNTGVDDLANTWAGGAFDYLTNGLIFPGDSSLSLDFDNDVEDLPDSGAPLPSSLVSGDGHRWHSFGNVRAGNNSPSPDYWTDGEGSESAYGLTFTGVPAEIGEVGSGVGDIEFGFDTFNFLPDYF